MSRALQPPFSKFITKIVPNQKWDHAQAFRYRQRYLKITCLAGIVYGLQGVVEIFGSRTRLMGLFFILLGTLTVIAFLIDTRKLQKARK
jgi:hypothetical protein